MTVFDPFCKFLQLNEPLVHICRCRLEAFIRTMQDCLIKPTQTRNELPSRVKHSVEAYQVDDKSLIVEDKVRDYFKHLSVYAKEEPCKKKNKVKKNVWH